CHEVNRPKWGLGGPDRCKIDSLHQGAAAGICPSATGFTPLRIESCPGLLALGKQTTASASGRLMSYCNRVG
ncbi:MAG: hypothetical protein RJP95_00025, partial [Pirellulales bacterium]